jgi:hypothetical protein
MAKITVTIDFIRTVDQDYPAQACLTEESFGGLSCSE